MKEREEGKREGKGGREREGEREGKGVREGGKVMEEETNTCLNLNFCKKFV